MTSFILAVRFRKFMAFLVFKLGQK